MVVARDRDIAAFDDRAARYEQGWLGQWHAGVTTRVAGIAAAAIPSARSVLDIGSGTGHLLRLLAADLAFVTELSGLDPAPAMVATARRSTSDPRVRFVVSAAEQLPKPDESVDLVVTTMSFDHWANQLAGLRECRRVLRPEGRLVLADLISPVLWPTVIVGRRGKARTRPRVERRLAEARLERCQWEPVATMVRAVTARPR